MNNDNLEFLQDSLKYLGFGEKLLLNQQLEESIAGEPKEFQLDTEHFFDEDHKLELALYFRRSEQADMYFFNKYEARLRSATDLELDRAQVFYISKGRGVTLKEAFNLLQGRAVNKDLTDADGQKYNAWIQLNFLEKDQYDNYKVKQFRPQYGYDLEKTLEKYPIKELKNEELKAGLIRSLKKGNLHPVSFQKILKTEKMFIEANPQYKTINIFPAVNRHGRKEPTGKGHGTMEELHEDEQAGTEAPKEEELETTGGKASTRKRTYK
ncbi:MAG: hypothetical protein Q8927_14650 [Bacteroidota bacterium]|nr:hypothetical protein [Bacteroidota bacterium]MDP4217438.1 hypothetical protein [Bacteroidota bacterium]MDP4247629.1 hypothetical protein [Bacteroidota bacterium]MDP4254069.1 hypothetical protein [Bacteroidota bacterium]MDP4260699.1 hypothetical protein [Bacteroidota bacterium]